jgi:hypothetical protein
MWSGHSCPLPLTLFLKLISALFLIFDPDLDPLPLQ